MTFNLIASVLLILTFASCQKADHESSEPVTTQAAATDLVRLSAQQIKNSGVTIAQAEQRDMHAALQVSGVVEAAPQNKVSITIPLGGYVKKMTLIPGQRVRKGDVLAVLEDQQYIQLQEDYLTAKSRLAFLEADYNRQRGLNETKATSDKLYQQALSDHNSQKILVRSLSEKLRLIGLAPEELTVETISRSLPVRAPINGYVTQVNVNTGKYVNPSDVLFELVNPDKLHIVLTVFEKDASRIVQGQKISCSTNSRPDEKFAATVHLITPSIQEDRTTEVHCHFDRTTGDLFPGTYMTATIELENARVTAVPEDAVVKWENKYYVFGAEGTNQFRMLPVEIGNSSEGFTEIRSKLQTKNIVTKNAYTILMKMKNASEEG